MAVQHNLISCPACRESVPDADFCNQCGHQLNPNLSIPQVVGHHISTGTTRMLKQAQQATVATAKKVTQKVTQVRNSQLTLRYLITGCILMIILSMLFNLGWCLIAGEVKYVTTFAFATSYAFTTRKWQNWREQLFINLLFILACLPGNFLAMWILTFFGFGS